jgi:Protein of unknown function (DUF3533)
MSGGTAVETRSSGLGFGRSDIMSTASGEADAKVEGESNVPVASQLTCLGEFKDAVSSRTVIMVMGVLVLQLGFILSYVGAFHSPKPVRIPLGVVAPASVSSKISNGINGIHGRPLAAREVSDKAAARRQIEDLTLTAALVVNPTSKTDTLLVASAGGTSLVSAVEAVTTAVEANVHRNVQVVDVVPLQKGDGHGLTGFYLVFGWIVGGYLCAALFGISSGAKAATFRRSIIRLLALVLYSLASGLGGVIVVGPVLGALSGHFVALWCLGTLIVFTAGAVTLAFQGLFGILGIALTVLLFVVLGNPSAGGAYQAGLLPPFWRAISSALPNGAGVDSARRIVYFGAQGIYGHLFVICLYALGGTVVTLLASLRNERKATRVALITTPQAVAC